MKISKLWAVAVLLATLSAIPAQAALDMFLEIPSIEGDATTAGFVGHISVLAWSWGASSAGCSTSNVNFQNISITKYLDKASVDLWGALDNGTVLPTATLRVARPSDGTVTKTIEMTNVYLTSISTGGSGGEDRLTENVSLGFSQATITYVDITSGKAEPAESVTVTVQGCP